MKTSKLLPCPHCEKELAKTVKVCPACGGETAYSDSEKKARTKVYIGAIILAFIAYFIFQMINSQIAAIDAAFNAEREYQCRVATNLPCK